MRKSPKRGILILRTLMSINLCRNKYLDEFKMKRGIQLPDWRNLQQNYKLNLPLHKR